MTDSPLAKLSRVLAGVALGNGHLGHQVLGQLLILNTRELEVAAAAVLLAAFSRQKDAALQAGVRILVPAVALHWITRRNETHLTQLSRIVDQKLAELGERERALVRRPRRPIPPPT